MTDWKTSNNRKAHQRALNREMRRINNNIANDNLWRGRFVVRQIGGQWKSYDRLPAQNLPTEYYYWVQLVLIDKKTGKFKILCDDSNHWCWGAHLFWKMNTFIINDCKVWEEEGREELYDKDKNDYRDWKAEIKDTWNPNIKITNPNGEVIEGKKIL